jgi:cytochrome c oxidase subunit 2
MRPGKFENPIFSTDLISGESCAKIYNKSAGRPRCLLLSYFDTPPTVAIYQALYNDYFILGTAAGVIVIALFVYLMIKYKHGEDDKVQDVAVHHEEKGWGNWKKGVLPLFVTGAVLFFVGLSTFNSAALVTIPQGPNNLQITVVASQFQWSFVYPDGHTQVGNLTVPEGTTVILNVTSQDVAHGFFMPALDVGVDAIPGRYNPIWFTAPTSPATDIIRCRELCGAGHATMIARLYVVDPAKYHAWYASLGAGK